MAYDPQVIRAAQERLEQRRSDADTRAAALRAKLTAQDPTLREIEVQVAEALPQITRVILDGGDAAALHAVQQRNLALQRQLADRLHALGYSENNFEPQYTCPKCRDTGYADGRMCDCYRRLLQEEACKRLSSFSAR